MKVSRTTLRSPVDAHPQHHLLSAPGPSHLPLPEAGDEGQRLLVWASAGLDFFLSPPTRCSSGFGTPSFPAATSSWLVWEDS